MSATPIDTFKAFKRLRNAGFDEKQAEAIVKVVVDAFGANLATKSENGDKAVGEGVQGETATEIVGDITHNMITKKDLHDFEVRLTVRLGGMIVAYGFLIVVGIRILS